MSKITEVLERNGATNIEGYVLVNNYGYCFNLPSGNRYDARFWANCYGAYIGRWDTMRASDKNSTPTEEETKLLEKITDELNEIGEE